MSQISNLKSYPEMQFLEHDGINTAYQIFPSKNSSVPQKSLIFLSGRWEPFVKYLDFISFLNHLGITVYCMDHRGQGFSSRVLKDPMKHHITDFQYYVNDVQFFIETVTPPKPLSLIGLSMGGAISSLHALQYPIWDKLILVSPMIQIASPAAYTYNFLKYVIKILTFLGFSEKYAFGKGPLNFEEERTQDFLSSDRLKYESFLKLLEKYPQAQLGGPTFGWVAAALKSTDTLLKKMKDIQIPTLILQAEKDTVVDIKAQSKISQIMPKAKLVTYPNALHEILLERDDISLKAYQEIANFLDLNISLNTQSDSLKLKNA